MLCLADLIFPTLPLPVAAVHHHAVLRQVLQGEGVDDMSRDGKDDHRLTESLLEAELTLAWSP